MPPGEVLLRRVAGVRAVASDLRLDRARADLRGGGRTVTEVATRWGFTNGGRFAAAYRERYGVLPSDDQCGGAPA